MGLRLVLTDFAYRQALQFFAEVGGVLRSDHVGWHAHGDDTEYLVNSLRPLGEPFGPEPEPGEPIVAVSDLPKYLRRVTWRFWLGARAAGTRIELGLDPDGGFSGAVVRGTRVDPLAEIRVAGRRMLRWTAPGIDVPAHRSNQGSDHSRTAGALGGEDVLARLQETHFCIIGVGRTGSLIAHALARLEIERLTLIDPDFVEPHNLDAMDVLARRAIGRPKAEAVRDFLVQCTRMSPKSIRVVVAPVDSAEALEAAAAADFIVTSPDHDRARMFGTEVATLYLRPHLDIGTGVFEEDGVWRAGSDVRLILPGDGCLLCIGGLPGLGRARRAPGGDWRAERAGSLRSVNSHAVGIGLQLIERLFVGGVGSSQWRRLEIDAAGNEDVGTEWVERSPDCAMCALAGRGDSAGRALSVQ